MSLYRKYRPAKFKDVIGQEQVVSVLESAIKSGKIGHAYLFSGTRGTGKTSVARIFAREIGTDPADLYEIDAASNRGIDEIRELREAVAVRPLNSEYKVYIIDEVHMLTTPAFNALLKTLEEPPSHCIFILATTELHKLPDTIVSRCQTFKFKRPSDEDIEKSISRVTKAEGYTIDKASIALVTLLAEGSYRDALTTLEKVMHTSKDKKVEIEEVELVTSAPKRELVQTFTTALAEGDVAKGLQILTQVGEANLDTRVFCKLVLRNLRFGMLLSLAPDLRIYIEGELGPQELAFVETLAKHPGNKRFPNALREFLVAYQDLGRSYIPTLPLELALIRLLGESKV